MAAEVAPRRLTFSQSSLETLERCPRRFYLRYIRDLAWPAPLTTAEEEWEASMRRGQLFHLLVQQSAMGVDVAPTVSALGDPELRQWWRHFCEHPPRGATGGALHTEIELSASIGPHRLVAKLDRVVCGPDGAVRIFDWKTGRAPPDRERLASSWQTTVYRYAVVESFGLARGVAPEQVELVYWHAAYPHALTPITYSRAEHAAARGRIQSAVSRVATAGSSEEAFAATPENGECLRCPYRSYCERGRSAAPDLDSELDDDVPAWRLVPGEPGADGAFDQC